MKRWAIERALTIERAAEQQLRQVPDWIWDGESLPIPLETIADSHYGLLVDEGIDLAALARLESDVHISGLLLPVPREIWVDAEEARQWPGRRRFTIAHEVGHWVLHCELGRSGEEPVHCRTDVLSAQGTAEAEDGQTPPEPHYPPPRERDANRFAAALLMPRALVEKEHAYLDGDEYRMAQEFGVSVLAMQWRVWFLEQLVDQ